MNMITKKNKTNKTTGNKESIHYNENVIYISWLSIVPDKFSLEEF